MSRRFLNNYEASITAATVAVGDLTFDVDVAPEALGTDDNYLITLTDSLTAPTKTEIVKVTDVTGTTLTVERAQEDTTAQSWVAGDILHLTATAGAFERPSAVTYTASSGAILRANGELQQYTMTANEAITFADLEDGDALTLHLSAADTWTPTFSLTWVGGTPTFGANTVLEIWKFGSTTFGASVGSY